MFEWKSKRLTRKYRVLHEGKTTNKFDVETCVKQGCIMSPLLFLLINRLDHKNTYRKWFTVDTMGPTRWSWLCRWHVSSFTKPESNARKSIMETTAVTLGLKVTKAKLWPCEVQRREQQPCCITRWITVLHITRKHCGNYRRTYNDVRTRIWKARAAFIVLNKIWKPKGRPNKFLTQILRRC